MPESPDIPAQRRPAGPRPTGRRGRARPALGLLGLLLAAGCAPRGAPELPWATRFPEADSIRTTEIAAGVGHAYLWFDEGPWAVHVVEVDEAVCTPAIEAVKAGPPLDARAPTSVLGGDALAAINADFFMLPGGTPVGAHVHDGRVLVGPGTRPLYGLDGEGGHHAGAGVPVGRMIAQGGPRGASAAGTAVPTDPTGSDRARPDTARVVQVNRPVVGGRHHPPKDGLTLFDSWYGLSAAPDSVGPTLRVRRVGDGVGDGGRDGGRDRGRDGGGGAAGGRYRGVVESIHGPTERVGLDADHVALQAVGPTAAAWLGRRAVGDSLAWEAAVAVALSTHVVGPPAVEAVGGFPLLVASGRGVYAEQAGVIASFGPRRHPRTAVGWDVMDERLYWVVVDGRQAPYSDGMSLPELEWLFLRLGATDALNLDGGGSTALALGGRVVNRPSDREGERPVANALVLRGCRRP